MTTPFMPIVLACRQMLPLAKRIADQNRTISLCDVDWKRFNDGWPDIFVQHIKSLVENRDVFFLASFDKPGDVFEQLALIYALPRYLARSVTVILPYFPTGTMERVDHEGQIATAQTLARMLSAIPLSTQGPARIVLYDIHALQGRFYFGDQVIPILETTMPLIKEILSKETNISIAFPDEGALKRFSSAFDDDNKIICSKTRLGDQRQVRIADGDPSGRHVVIVDDLVHSGTTLIECRNALIEAGAALVSCFVPHAIFEKRAWEKFIGQNAGLFANFWVTDSCPTTIKKIGNQAPFKVLSLAPSIAHFILTSR